MPHRSVSFDLADAADHSREISERLGLVAAWATPKRHLVSEGQTVFQSGDRFAHLFIVNSGFYKVVMSTRDSREQIVSVKFRGDWLGFDGISDGEHNCDVVAMDTGEVWAIPYASLLSSSPGAHELIPMLHAAMSREIIGDRNAMMSNRVLSADARIADFLRNWACALACRGLRVDQILLRMSRAEIANYLGLSTETVSRGFSRLAQAGLIALKGKGRRDIVITELAALDDFVQKLRSTTRQFQ